MTVRTVLATLALTLAPAQPMAEPPRLVATAHVAHVTVLKPPPRPGPDAAEVVGECESGNDYTAHNPTSSASGRHQWIDSTWLWWTGLEPPAADHPPAVQDAAFWSLWNVDRRHWNASKRCWAPALEAS